MPISQCGPTRTQQEGRGPTEESLCIATARRGRWFASGRQPSDRKLFVELLEDRCQPSFLAPVSYPVSPIPYDPTDVVKAGDRVRVLSGPVSGTFEIRAVPDPAVAQLSAHHMEVQIIEVAQPRTGLFPGGTVEEG